MSEATPKNKSILLIQEKCKEAKNSLHDPTKIFDILQDIHNEVESWKMMNDLLTDERSLQRGDQVVMVGCGEAIEYPGRVWVCESDQWEQSEGTNLVELGGMDGAFDRRYLQYVDITQSIDLEDQS